MTQKGKYDLRIIDDSWYIKPNRIFVRLAAGGVVIRKVNGIPYIAVVAEESHPDEYALPKGGVEKGETIEIAARREIHEEAGFTDLSLIKFLDKKERLSFSKKHWSVTHFFLFETSEIHTIPSDKFKTYHVFWFPLSEAPNLFWREQNEIVEMVKEYYSYAE